MARTQPPNPNLPVGSTTHPIIPPNQRLPFVSPDTGVLTPYGMQFLQQVFALLQGSSGVISQIDDQSLFNQITVMPNDAPVEQINNQLEIILPIDPPVDSNQITLKGNEIQPPQDPVNTDQIIMKSLMLEIL